MNMLQILKAASRTVDGKQEEYRKQSSHISEAVPKRPNTPPMIIMLLT